MTQKTSLPNNLYALPPLEADQHQKQIADRMAETLNAATSPYDSHPTPRERFALIEHLPQPNAPEESTRPVVDLIPTVERLQQEMTAVIQENVRRAQE